MDSLDIRLYRAMFPGNVMGIQSFDPRLSIQDLSRATGVSRITVRRRLALWREEGFWTGVVAFPNPEALETSFQVQSIALDPGRGRSRSERALIDVLEPVFLFQTDNVYNPILLAESREASDRRQRKFQEIDGGHLLCPPIDFPLVAPSIMLGMKDWRIIQSLRRFPGPDWQAVAKDVGVTLRTLQRRVARLMDGHSLFFFPDVDFRRLPGTIAWVGILFGLGVDPVRLEAMISEQYPDLFRVDPIFPFENLLPQSDRPAIGGRFPFFLPVPSASSADRLRRDFMTVPGVIDVLVGFPTQGISFPHALDSRIKSVIDRLSETDSTVSSGINPWKSLTRLRSTRAPRAEL
jgi:DNA-binding Lrp family transcriptional regulator